MFGNKIRKTIFIEGMSCGHCSKRVETALKSINGVKSVSISLEDKKAEIVLKSDVSDEILRSAVEELGFEVIDVKTN